MLTRDECKPEPIHVSIASVFIAMPMASTFVGCGYRRVQLQSEHSSYLPRRSRYAPLRIVSATLFGISLYLYSRVLTLRRPRDRILA
ncbi:hypothetical protein EV127DRAFT_421037 [Xylaria flabelliformis]|nr:hypothetical protein EV127DRAFT_421037 [Xylaria flabelliformis]